MSVESETKAVAAPVPVSWLRRFQRNLVLGLAAPTRPPRAPYPARLVWREPARLAALALAAVILVAASMALLDARVLQATVRLPSWLIDPFNRLTGFGKSGWFLWPTGAALVLIAALAPPTLPRFTRQVTGAIAVRLGFVFVAIGAPGLSAAIIKRLIGRARPLTEFDANPFLYSPFVWRTEYASMPSGHATTAFAALIAIGAIWPRLRPVMWVFALLIALSRVVISVHYPSDVIAGAFIGVVGALIVRDWYAARRLGFAFDAHGGVRALPGPSFARVKRVAWQLVAPYVTRAGR